MILSCGFRYFSLLFLLLSLFLPSPSLGAEEAKQPPIAKDSVNLNHPEELKKIEQAVMTLKESKTLQELKPLQEMLKSLQEILKSQQALKAQQAVKGGPEPKAQLLVKDDKPVVADNPYGDRPGFWAQPKFKSGQPQDWWERSSFEYEPEYPYFLKRFTGQLSFTKLTGSSDGHLAMGGAELILRKGRFTNSNSYMIDQKDIVSETGYTVLDRDLQNFDETLRYEFNRHLFIETGMIWRRISTVYIRDRFIPFIGLGTYNILYTLGQNNKKDLLGIHLGLVNIFDKYYPFVAQLTGKESNQYPAFYLSANYTHIFNDHFTYRQFLFHKYGLAKTPVYQESPDWSRATIKDNSYRYDYRWSNSIEFNYNRTIGLSLSYDLIYDSNPWPTKANLDTLLSLFFRFMVW